MRRHIAIAAALLVMFVGVSAAQNTPVAQNTPAARDDVLAADINRIIGNNVYYTVYDLISVDVNDHVATLSGVVTAPYKRASFIKEIKAVLGDDIKIEDKITVLPPSSSDDRLRYILARSIYNDSRLLRYGLSRWPYPIHIIVSNGRVRLEGEVRTVMDKLIIESKARGMIGVVSVKNNLEVV